MFVFLSALISSSLWAVELLARLLQYTQETCQEQASATTISPICTCGLDLTVVLLGIAIRCSDAKVCAIPQRRSGCCTEREREHDGERRDGRGRETLHKRPFW